jgi:Kef-type K+ transport system membrane component KefB
VRIHLPPIQRLLGPLFAVTLGLAVALSAHGEKPAAKAKTTKEDADKLVTYLLPKAIERLDKRELVPFGAMLEASGEMSLVTARDGPDSKTSQELLDRMFNISLQGKVLEKKHKIKATAAVFDARVLPPGEKEKSDAIAVYVDHREDYSINVYFPYHLSPRGQVVVGKPFSTWGSRRVYFPRQ